MLNTHVNSTKAPGAPEQFVINRNTDRSRLKLVDPRGVWFTKLHWASVGFSAVDSGLDTRAGWSRQLRLLPTSTVGRTLQYPDAPRRHDPPKTDGLNTRTRLSRTTEFSRQALVDSG